MSKKKTKVVNVTVKSTKQRLRILNGMFQLTEKELTILAAFLDKADQLEDTGISVFSAEAKKSIAESLDIDDFNTLNVYIKRLKDKQALIYTGNYEFNELVKRGKNEKGILFRWKEKKN